MLDRTASLARDEAINAAVESAIDESLRDGPWAEALTHHLAKHGLVIVDSARHDKLLATLQFVGSVLDCDEPLRAIKNAVNITLKGL